ncbi:MAG: class I SAM-dependent methyltransferase [Crocosphaera sp.]|nr:class I SAM-dependent methyltransferase [Crocosphaera sp.]
MNSSNNQCNICFNLQSNQSYWVKEMMFGYRDEFEYFQCSQCGCLQIKDIPKNLSKYYPKSYFEQPKKHLLKKENAVKQLLIKERNKYLIGENNLLGFLINSQYPATEKTPVFCGWDWRKDFKTYSLNLQSSLLDVGCGHGSLLYYLRKQGCSNLTGVDPYIEEDIYTEGIKIYKKELEKLDSQFDFITLHHSFEHMDDPLRVMENLYRLLKNDRYLLIRIPVASSFAWKKYGVNWCQIDAPRHFYLHTPNSMNILAQKVGFTIKNIVYDSTDFQFLVSEKYLRDIPLKDRTHTQTSLFSQETLQNFVNQAQELNQKQEGDQACFYLYKS